MSYILRLDARSKVPQMDQQTRRAAENAVRETTDLAMRTLMTRAPSATGKLKSGFRKIVAGLTSRITSSVSYTMVVEKGSRPHTIVPKTAKVLHFLIGGVDVFARSVQHPGTAGKFFIAGTKDVLRAEGPKIMRKHLRNVGGPIR